MQCSTKDVINRRATPNNGVFPLLWRHNGHGSVSNHHCLLNRLFGCKSKKTSKLRVTGLCVGNSPGTGEFPTQMASNAENVSIWWRHHASIKYICEHSLPTPAKYLLDAFDIENKKLLKRKAPVLPALEAMMAVGECVGLIDFCNMFNKMEAISQTTWM